MSYSPLPNLPSLPALPSLSIRPSRRLDEQAQINQAILNMPRTNFPPALLQQIFDILQAISNRPLNLLNLSTAINQIGKRVKVLQEKNFQPLRNTQARIKADIVTSLKENIAALEQLETTKDPARAICNLMTGLSQCGVCIESLEVNQRNILLKVIFNLLDRLNVQGVATIFWTLPNIGFKKKDFAPELIDLLFRAADKYFLQLDSVEITNIISGWAFLGFSWQDLLPYKLWDKIQYVIKTSISERQLKLENIPDLCLALVNINIPEQYLTNQEWLNILLQQGIAGKINLFMPKDLTRILWSFAKMHVTWQKLIELGIQKQILAAIKDKTQLFNMPDLAATLKVLAGWKLTNNQLGLELSDKLLVEISKKVGFFKKIDVTDISWALASLDFHHSSLKPDLTSNLLLATTKYITLFNQQDTAIIIWSFGRMGISKAMLDRDNLTEKILHALNKNINLFNEQDLANIFLGLSNIELLLESSNSNLNRRLLQQVTNKIADLKYQEAAIIFWSLAIMDYLQLDPTLTNALMSRNLNFLQNMDTQSLNIRLYNQVWQAALAIDVNLPDWFYKLSIRKQGNESSSFLHKEVYMNISKIFADKKLTYRIENEIPCCGYYIDIGVFLDSKDQTKNYAIDVLGPTHFDEFKQLNPVDKFRHRILRKQNWEVIMLPHFELDALRAAQWPSFLESKMLASGIKLNDLSDV